MSDTLFLNNQEMIVDAKLRVGIPERFMKVLRKIAPDHSRQIGVAASPDRSIKLMPHPYFAEELERWQALDVNKSADRTILNLSSSFADLLSMDKQNRIKLSPALCKFCNITRDVIIVGSLKYMQIFDIGIWNALTETGISQFDGALDTAAQNAGRPAPVHLVINAEHKKEDPSAKD